MRVFWFKQWVPVPGFHWQTARPVRSDDKPRPEQIVLMKPMVECQEKGYDPLFDCPRLYSSEFIRINLDPKYVQTSILRFANKYGWLGRPEMVTINGAGLYLGEPLSLWIHAIAELQGAVWLWVNSERENTRELATRLELLPDFLVYKCPSGRIWNLQRTTVPAELNSDICSLAKFLVQQVVNEHLADQSSVALLWDEPKFTHMGRYFRPNDFLAAMWIQFAEAVDGKRKFYRCVLCGRWFEAKRKAKTCSGNCRIKFLQDPDTRKSKTAGKPARRKD